MRPLSTDGAILILELGCMRDFCAFIKSVRWTGQPMPLVMHD